MVLLCLHDTDCTRNVIKDLSICTTCIASLRNKPNIPLGLGIVLIMNNMIEFEPVELLYQRLLDKLQPTIM